MKKRLIAAIGLAGLTMIGAASLYAAAELIGWQPPEVDQRVGRAALDFEHEADFGLRTQRRGYTQLDRPLDER